VRSVQRFYTLSFTEIFHLWLFTAKLFFAFSRVQLGTTSELLTFRYATPGIGVSFENGSGARPVASNVTVVDSTTITAMVTVKTGGGPRSDRVWDVRVGSDVLPNGFTVQP